ncbi:MAG TPA: DNA-3-methyladenine glycosylase [Bauldia sp.]|nr:DNA-3-methyladenine glycosylase [Bauldia sp.]
MRIIENDADIAEGLAYLAGRDRRLKKVIREAGPVPLRRRPAGFTGLARIIVGQQLSIASAEAIWRRFEAAYPETPIEAIAAASDAELKATGLSAAKIRTLRAVAQAAVDGLDLNALAALPMEDAHGRLTGLKGIGPWTADIYLLFCLGHADIFPAGDLALRHAVADAFGLEGPVPVDELAGIAEKWSPWRGVAARLFWAYYRVRRERAAQPV